MSCPAPSARACQGVARRTSPSTTGENGIVLSAGRPQRCAYWFSEALTESAGAHPLFNGIRRVEIVMPSKPMVTREAGVVTVSAPGLQGRFTSAEAVEEQRRIVVRSRR